MVGLVVGSVVVVAAVRAGKTVLALSECVVGERAKKMPSRDSAS